MNNDFLRWLLSVDVIPADAESLYVVWERPFPGWLWFILFMAAGLFAVWSYHRLVGPRAGRGALAALRFAIILLALVLISGPMLEMPRETVEEDWILTIVDRSASMQIADVRIGDDPRQRMSREEQLRAMLARNRAIFDHLDADRELIWLGFHLGAFNLAATPEDDEAGDGLPVALGDADGSGTRLGTALEQALQRAAARPLSGVIIASDGRTTDPPSRALIRRLQADAVPVFTVPLGSPDPLADVAIRRIDAPRRAYVGDKVPIVVRLDRLGEAAREIGGTVRLIDEDSGEELAREDFEPGDDRDEITLTAEPDLAGTAAWRVEVETDEPPLVPENTLAAFNIELIDSPVRVLYIDGYPRWEYRYVKNLLIREESIESSVMLLSADREFAQEGNQPISRLPRSPGEFGEFDVIVLGDVPASFFSPEQLEMMRDHVAERGGGLLWIGGERYTPRTFAGTALADLLPVRGSLDLSRIASRVHMAPTELADRLGVLQLSTPEETGWPRALTEPTAGWSALRWAQRLDPARIKPATEILAHTSEEVGGEHLPLVTMTRFGAGRSIYVATDEIWRWRYGRGELLPEQFWVQMLRMLAREGEMGLTAGERAVLEANPRRVQIGQPLHIALHLLDQQLVDAAGQTVRVTFEDAEGTRRTTLDLTPQRPGDAPRADQRGRSGTRAAGHPARYVATYIPDQPGRFQVRLDDANLEDVVGPIRLTEQVEVVTPDDEMRRPETDHDLLADLAEATGGRMLSHHEIDQLPDLLPNRAIVTQSPLRERIWDTPLFFFLLLALLTLEWVGRKVLRLI